jgi:hypothetical protein
VKRNGKPLLLIGASLNFLIALLHIGIVIVGAPAYIYFGATDLAQFAAQGSPIPAVVTLILAAIFVVFAVYALSGVGWLPRLPLLRVGLILIGCIYVLRGLIVVLDLLRLVYGMGYPVRQTIFSAIALIIGLVYLVGTFQQWDHLRSNVETS